MPFGFGQAASQFQKTKMIYSSVCFAQKGGVSMRFSIGRIFLLVGLLIFLCRGPAHAAFFTYTSEADFLSGISGFDQQTLNFENLAPGTTISSGDTVGGITFTYDISGETMIVTDRYDTTSGSKSLGLTGGDDAFWDREAFGLSFGGPTNALGMSFITSDPVIDNEIQLITNLGVAYVDADVYTILDDGGYAYYIGLSSSEWFYSANIGFLDDGETNFVYNVDDITTAVIPEPATMLLLGFGLIGFAAARRKFKRQDHIGG